MSTGLRVEKGSAHPLGNSVLDGGINFALFSQHATELALCLFHPDEQNPFLEVRLDPTIHRTGWVWHAQIFGLPEQVEYAYRCNGPSKHGHGFNPALYLSDPYARAVSERSRWGTTTGKVQHRGKVIANHPFDWQGDQLPRIPMQDLVIYEMHVRGFTQHGSSHVHNPGTFLGVIEKIPYLKHLGVNAIELLPVFQFDENDYQGVNPITKDPLKNYWGYATINFFAPMNRFGTGSRWGGTIDEFKTMVRELHKNKIEVILDVVYNHTAEGGMGGPTYNLRGLDNTVYYMVDGNGKYRDYTGCGNTVNCNNPITEKFILDSLRYWVTEMHIDGFRFDLASILTRGQDGAPLAHPPLIDAISKDPVLAGIKLIAEPWDAAGLYQVGNFPCGEEWAEWNGRYRDSVRRFIKGADGQAGEFASSLCGSQHLFGATKAPYHSLNFITAHDGFSLHDLVSYNGKHNEINGEGNRDGMNDNDSWNCGAEGATTNRKIISLRDRQKRNFHLALMVSIGTPMILMGDEYGRTAHGNNNTWCQDNELNWFLWDQIDHDEAFFRFYAQLIDFRKRHPILRRDTFLGNEDVEWHGTTPLHPDWGLHSRFVAYTLKDPVQHNNLYIAFNAGFNSAHIQLPPPPDQKKWHRVVDTSLAPPTDLIAESESQPLLHATYDLPSHSALLAKAL
jgi:isoamylase